jgi:hypothetical protein
LKSNTVHLVGFEVLTVVVMKNSVFRDITLCSPLKVNGRFKGTYHNHLQVRTISQARNQHEADSKQGLLGMFFDPEGGGDTFL